MKIKKNRIIFANLYSVCCFSDKIKTWNLIIKQFMFWTATD